MSKIVQKYCELPGFIRKPLWKFWHKTILNYDKNKDAIFMNYGYASKNGEFDNLKLDVKDEYDRYSIQLYDHVTKNFEFQNTDVLEVGSGRGGGASFIARYKKPKSYVALDISKKTKDFCNSFHKVDNLKFVQGDAQNLPFDNEKFDALINVESARCYNDIDKFFSEVYRVLKPTGKFLFADMIKKEDFDNIMAKIKEADFIIEHKNDIRPNVVEALKLDSQQRKKAIDKAVPGFLQKHFYQFAGVEGTNRFEEFNSGKMGYWSFILSKNGK